MKPFRLFLALSVLLSTFQSFGQKYYDIKIPKNNNLPKHCRECITLLRTKPKEIKFGIFRDEDDKLYFMVTNAEWFDRLFEKSGDGIAIHIVRKSKYQCNGRKPTGKLTLSDLMPPVYLKDLKKNQMVSDAGSVTIPIGRVPSKFREEDIEFNLLILKDKNLCRYQKFYDLATYRWDLLDMGFYFDTLIYKTNFNLSVSEREQYILQHKVLKFEIPFEKNKSEYSMEDIRPLYDSLRLTDFNIKKITIRAYSSVEGNESRNVLLQNERARSIVSALQSWQIPSIETEIVVSENWVEFLDDIAQTPYKSLIELSKDEIKRKLQDRKLVENLESFLKGHRKAVVILELQKKDKYENLSVEVLSELFSKSIEKKNLEEAIEIQNSIFEKVRNHEIPADLLDKLEIPEKTEFSLLLNKNSIFKYLMDASDVYSTFMELSDLQDLIPDDPHLKYNICALKFKVWLLGDNLINPVEFRQEIIELRRWNIPDPLVKRMLINYEILMSEYQMAKGEFAGKDKSLNYIYLNYKNVPLSDFDYLSLAQYFASYSRYDWATNLLAPKVKKVDVDEDLLFYYLNLTLIHDHLIRRSDYRTILLNAININPRRFCMIFEPKGKGGVTFQLLENDFLRKTYCESCN